MVRRLFAQIAEACAAHAVALIGGHTEVTPGIDRPLVAGTMLGEVAKDRLVTTAGARVGDAVLLTKGVPLEGAAIIAREKERELLARGVPASVIRTAQGLSCARPASACCGRRRSPAMWRMCTRCTTRPRGESPPRCTNSPQPPVSGCASTTTASVVLPEGRALCAAFGLDPLGTIASGALLLTLPVTRPRLVLDALARASIDAQIIGEVVPAEQGVTLIAGTRQWPLPTFARDEIARLFEES